MTSSVLLVENLDSGYGRVQVLFNVSIRVDPGETIGIIGPNGAGKTTLVRSIMGFIKPWRGKVFYMGRDITLLKPYEKIRLGIGYCPERGGVLRTLSVDDNIGLVLAVKKTSREKLDFVEKLFPILRERRKQVAGTLSGGEQRMIAVAKALLLAENLLILDEPSAGLAPILKKRLAERLLEIKRKENISMLITEQDPYLVKAVADRVYVMERGVIAKKGSTDEVLKEEVLREHYLGI